MVTQATPLPIYENPPVNEVVCGILFTRLDELLTPYLGLLWEKYKPEYSKCQEVAPIMPIIESFDQRASQEVEMLPLPRTWFVHDNERGIIQIQRDRFLHNWRKMQRSDEYPHYESVVRDFRAYLLIFTEFLKENNLGVLIPLQYELTYINHIMQGEGWETINDVEKIFPNFSWQKGKNSFLTSPEIINWHTSFVLPDRTGRLHAKIQSATRQTDKHPVLQFELTVRGIGNYSTLDAMWSWFGLAHEWIVRGFSDLTDSQVQKDIWRRTI